MTTPVRVKILLVGAAFVVYGLTLVAQRASRPASARGPARPAVPAPSSRVERVVPFSVGETLTYDISWSGYLTAGTAVTTVREKKSSFNSVAYYAVAEGRPTSLVSKLYTLYYKLDTLIDTYTLLSQRGSLYSEEGHRHRYQITEFDRTTNTARFEFQSGNVTNDQARVPAASQDMLSAIYAIRATPFKPGDRFTIPVCDRGTTYRVELAVGSVEIVRAPIGSSSAWRIGVGVTDGQGKPVGKNLALWIGEDARRLPVKMQAELPVGSFSLALHDASSIGGPR